MDRDDFLFHLYRGSDMLMQDRVLEAKEELERALSLQPSDAKSQDLLAGVYFRLGVYPRAIEIWERLTAAYPRDATLRVNLALALFKTGQADEALAALHAALRMQPDHERAWGYLGLVHWRTGKIEQARDAFLRGGQASMARRMEELLQGSQRDAGETGTSAMPMTPESSTFDGGVPASSSAKEPEPSRVPDLATFLERHGVRTDDATFTFSPEGDLFLRASDGLFVRATGLAAVRSATAPTTATRRAKPAEGEAPLGGAAPIHRFEGAVTGMATRPWGRTFHAVRLRSETMYVRESVLFAFEPPLVYECAELALGTTDLALVQVSGQGTMVLLTEGTPHVLAIGSDADLRVDPTRLVGWAGRLFPSAERSPLGGLSLVLRGEGAAILC